MSEKVFFHTAHKALWNWLSKHPGKNKNDWPGWEYNKGKVSRVRSSCFACEYVVNRPDCAECPLDWGIGGGCFAGGYYEWKNAFDNECFDKLIILAAQIRDIHVREGVVCK